MREALKEARKGVGLTSPNPPVGAVVVKKGEELGRGYHRVAGGPHAERMAIESAKSCHGAESLLGACLYVTLEPCSTHGRTGACTEAVLAEGIERLVFGAEDPNPAHAGRGADILRGQGVEVVSGVEEGACQRLIRPFAKVQSTGLPWIVVKTAMTLDGSITRPPGEGPWLSNLQSRAEVQELRVEADAILTTGETVRQDDARLTLRGEAVPSEKQQPWRVILTRRDDGIPENAQILSDSFASRTLIRKGMSIEEVLRQLVVDQDVNSVLVEAGGQFVGQLLDEGWVDELVVYLVPLLTAGPTPAVGGEGVADLAQRWRLGEISYQKFGSDVRLRGVISGQGGELAR